MADKQTAAASADQRMADAKAKTEAYLVTVWNKMANKSWEQRRVFINTYVTNVAALESWKVKYKLTQEEIDLCDMIVSSGFSMLKVRPDMKTGEVKIEILMPKPPAAKSNEPDELEKMVDAIEDQYRKNK